MNINLMKLKGVVQELRGIRHELSRLADCWEIELSQQGYNVRPPKADTSGPEPTLTVTDEEEDFIHEIDEFVKRQDERKAAEEADV